MISLHAIYLSHIVWHGVDLIFFILGLFSILLLLLGLCSLSNLEKASFEN